MEDPVLATNRPYVIHRHHCQDEDRRDNEYLHCISDSELKSERIARNKDPSDSDCITQPVEGGIQRMLLRVV